MGTDIHGVVQTRYKGRDGRPPSAWSTECEIERGRNYLLFAILADVRNGFGFAGCKTHDAIEPIQRGRGLPEGFKVNDHGDHVWGYDDQNRAWMGDHSFGWVTLEEVESWPGWDKPIGQEGVIDRAEYLRWKSSGDAMPRSWSGDVMGGQTAVVDGVEVAGAAFVPETATHVRARWGITPRERVGETFATWIKYIRLAHGPDYAEVRLVFGFDS